MAALLSCASLAACARVVSGQSAGGQLRAATCNEAMALQNFCAQPHSRIAHTLVQRLDGGLQETGRGVSASSYGWPLKGLQGGATAALSLSSPSAICDRAPLKCCCASLQCSAAPDGCERVGGAQQQKHAKRLPAWSFLPMASEALTSDAVPAFMAWLTCKPIVTRPGHKSEQGEAP